MSDSSGNRRWVWPRTGTVIALLAGAAIGGWAGAYMRGSGMFYSDLFVGAVLILVLVAAGIGAAVSAHVDHVAAARALSGFAIAIVVAAGTMFTISAPYRGVNPGITYSGSATMRTAELPPYEWPMGSRCLIRDNEASVFSTEVNLRYATKQTISAAMQFVPTGSWPRPGISIVVLTIPETPAFYAADFGSGADLVLDSADGLRGHVQFALTRAPDQFRSPRPDEPARLTGTLEWDCTVPPLAPPSTTTAPSSAAGTDWWGPREHLSRRRLGRLACRLVPRGRATAAAVSLPTPGASIVWSRSREMGMTQRREPAGGHI